MKKYINISFAYAIAAMVAGVFYREFTKYIGYTEVTTLSKIHPHLFILGMMMFLLVALFVHSINLESQKTFKAFMVLYNIGVPMTAIMLLVRGLAQTNILELSRGADAAISGMAGIAHILAGTGIVALFIAIRKELAKK